MPNPKIWGDSNLKGAVAVGIDQSYSGFAMTAIDDDGNYYTEVHKLTGAGVERLVDAQRITQCFLDNFNVRCVAMEGYAFGSQMANMLGELGGAVKLTLHHYGITPETETPLIVPPTSLKKYITGKGTGVKKNQVLLSVYKKWDVEFTDDNAADSYGLARLVRNKHDFEYEKEVYDKLTSPGK
jgi:Holliday junction resolvasome RuvABC endonuclease subunit